MMIRRFCHAAVSCAAAFVLAGCGGDSASGPIAAGPVTWAATAGASASQEALQVLRFYPQDITVNAGDSVQWSFPAGEPHTVTLLGPRTSVPAPSDPTDSAPAGPTSYDGSSYVSSGFKLLGQSYTMKFPKAGTYVYQCLIHPGMKGTVHVQPALTTYPSNQAAYTTAATTQRSADLATDAAAVTSFPFAAGGPHLEAGMSPGMAMGASSALTVMRFLDGPSLSDTSVTIAVGQTVTWTNESNNEPHTVTIAPVGAAFPNLNPFGPPTGGNTYDGSTLVNSGVLLPGQSFSLQFLRAGTYTYHCIFHDDTENMIGTVVVQ